MRQYTKAKALLESLKTIPDYRVDIGKIEYPLAEVLFMMIFALLKGNTKFKEIFGWMVYNKNNPLLKEIFEKEEVKMPSKSTLHNILTNTDNNTLERVFREYFSNYVKKENIAIDGKWLNGSDANGQYTGKVYHKSVLHIFDKDSKIALGHKFMEKSKLSEIPAFNEILKDKTFSNSGQIYTTDALHTQTTSLNTINDNNEYFLAKVKANQKLLKDKLYLQ